MENNDKVFLNSFKIKLDNGEYDEHLTLPFMNKKLLMAAVEGRIKRKLEKGTAPLLTDLEVQSSINEAKEAAGGTFYLMVKYNILEPNEDGGYQLSRKGARALREISRM